MKLEKTTHIYCDSCHKPGVTYALVVRGILGARDGGLSFGRLCHVCWQQAKKAIEVYFEKDLE